MKKLRHLLLMVMCTIAMVLGTAAIVSATEDGYVYTDASGNKYTYSASSGGYIYTGYTTARTSLTVPAKLADGNPVVGIKSHAFNPGLKTLTLDCAITSDFKLVFMGITGLQSLTFNGRVDAVPYLPTEWETTLEIIRLKGGTAEFPYMPYFSALKEYTVSSLTQSAELRSSSLCRASKLTKLTIPTKASLNYFSFSGLTGLTSLTINCGVGDDGLGLTGLTSLKTFTVKGYVTGTINFPSSVETIKYLGGVRNFPSFRGCANLSTIQISKCSSSVIKGYSFDGCNITSFTVPANITTIEKSAFAGCGIRYINFETGSKLKTVKEYAFYNAKELRKVTFPSTLTSIGDWAFWGDTKLYTVKLPSATTKFGYDPFYECNKTRLTIVAPSTSKAAEYAKSNGLLTTTGTALKVTSGPTKTYVGGKLRMNIYNNSKKVTYKSSNTGVATVSSTGLITGKKAGTAKITATIGGVNYTYTYTVVKRTQANVLDIIYKYYVKPDMSDYEKIEAADAWICANVRYDYSNYLANTVPDISHTAKGAFEKGVAVCDGYAYAFDIIMKHYGISDVVCIGYAGGGGHAWNEVKVGSNWYYIDTCWDDPVNAKNNNTVSAKGYFLVTEGKLARDHSWTASNYHPATATTFNKQINHTGISGAVINYTKISVNKGSTVTLKVTGTKQTVSFSSADKTIAKVSSKGVVTGVKKGTTKINVKIGTKTVKVKVTVK